MNTSRVQRCTVTLYASAGTWIEQVSMENGYNSWALVADQLEPYTDLEKFCTSIGCVLDGPYEGKYNDPS